MQLNYCQYIPQRNIKIPLGFATAFLNIRKSALPALTTYLTLKTIHSNGVILDFWKNKKRIAEYIGIDPSTLSVHYRQLRNLGWVELKDKRLHLTSINNISKVLRAHTYVSKSKTFTIEKTTIKHLKLWFKQCAMKDLQYKQHFAIEREKLKNSTSKRNTLALPKCDFSSSLIGRTGFSHAIGCTHPSTSSRYIDQMKKEKMVKRDKRKYKLEFESDNYEHLKLVRNQMRNEGFHVIIKDGCVYRVLSNEVRFA